MCLKILTERNFRLRLSNEPRLIRLLQDIMVTGHATHASYYSAGVATTVWNLKAPLNFTSAFISFAMSALLGYWNIRGLAQAIRFAAAYGEQELDEKRYNCGPAPEYDRGEWLADKHSLGLAFPNLPYYIDGDIKITQSLAIIRHIARKHKFDGTSEEEKIRIDIAEQQLNDFRMGFVRLCYNPDFETLKADYIKNLPDQLKALSEFLGKRKWVAGDNFSYVDILLYDMLNQHKMLVPDCLADYPNLEEHIKKFEDLPAIAKYMKSDKFMKSPLNGAMAKFGNA